MKKKEQELRDLESSSSDEEIIIKKKKSPKIIYVNEEEDKKPVNIVINTHNLPQTEPKIEPKKRIQAFF